MTYPPPAFPDPSTRDRVHTLLAEAGYREDVIAEHVPGRGFARGRMSRRALRRTEGLDDRLHALLLLFLFDSPVPEEEARAALGSAGVEALVSSGMVVEEDSSLRPTLHLVPFHGVAIASDVRERHEERAADFVLGAFGTARNLAACALRGPAGSVLDLGCGSGALALYASGWSERVVATDINARAVAFSRFNAELNGAGNVEVREGSLFEPVEGERFDLVLCNPPYAISPGSTFVYRDGEPGICRRIVRGAPEHLTDRGILQMTLEWPERPGSDWADEPLSWAEGLGCDVWLLRMYSHRPEAYARQWLSQEHGATPPDGAVTAWAEHLDALGIERVGGGVLILRRSRSDRPVQVRREGAGARHDGMSETLRGWIDAHTLLADHPDREDLLDLRLVPAPGLESALRRELTEDGWTERKRQLRLSRGTRFEADVDPVIEEIVGRLAGGRTPREALRRFTERHGLEPDPFLPGLPDAMARLLELGLVLPASDDVRTPA